MVRRRGEFLRRTLRRVRPLVAIYGSFHATPTVWDGLILVLYRFLTWLVHLASVSPRLHLWATSRSRRLSLTFRLLHPGGLPLRLTLPVHPQTFWTLYEIFHAQAYRPALNLRPRVIVDVGANIGLASLYLYGLYPRARFICIEPDASSVDLLRRNLEQNGVEHVVVASVISGGGGEVEFHRHRACSEYSSLRPTSFPADQYDVTPAQSRTLGSVLVEQGVERVSILKIDVEGAEFEILAQSSAVVSGSDYVMGEFHAAAGDVPRLVATLRVQAGLAVVREAGRPALPILHFARPSTT